MNLRRLMYFIKIVDTGNMTQASELLHIAQPALSQQLATLESEFEAQLLVRTKRGMAPTEAGKALYRHAQIMLRQLEQAQSAVRNAGKSLSGLVTVGIVPGIAASALALPLLKIVHHRHPAIMLNFNDAVLALATGQMQSEVALDVFRHLYQEAAKTRDMRFIQVVAWFAASIESQLSSTRTVEYAKSIIDKVLSRTTAGIEVMISVKLNSVEMKAPLVLSPHWRY